MVLLTDEEMLVGNLPMEDEGYEYGRAIAQAQLKKVVEWILSEGDYDCGHFIFDIDQDIWNCVVEEVRHEGHEGGI